MDENDVSMCTGLQVSTQTQLFARWPISEYVDVSITCLQVKIHRCKYLYRPKSKYVDGGLCFPV